jgi:hypothetical protein
VGVTSGTDRLQAASSAASSRTANRRNIHAPSSNELGHGAPCPHKTIICLQWLPGDKRLHAG